MEAQRTREKNEPSDGKFVPSAPPDYDEESLSHAIDTDSWNLPDLIDRPQRTSFFSRLKNAFNNYKLLRREQQNNRLVDPTTNSIDYSNHNDSSSFNNDNDDVFGDLKTRNVFFKKLIGWLSLQQSLLVTLAALFFYVPHFRHMFRRIFADKLFLKNYIFGPIGILVICLLMLQSVRRRFPTASYIAITASLCSLLCYIMSYEKDNLFVLMELSFLDVSFLSANSLNFLTPNFNLRNRLQSLYFPASMGTLQCLQPLLTKRTFASSWYLNVASIAVTSFLGYNVSSVMNDSKLNLKANESLFAATEVFIAPINAIPKSIYKKFSRRAHTSSFQRI